MKQELYMKNREDYIKYYKGAECENDLMFYAKVLSFYIYLYRKYEGKDNFKWIFTNNDDSLWLSCSGSIRRKCYFLNKDDLKTHGVPPLKIDDVIKDIISSGCRLPPELE